MLINKLHILYLNYKDFYYIESSLKLFNIKWNFIYGLKKANRNWY